MADENSDLTTRGTPRQRAATPARVEANRQANRQHGLRSEFAETGDETVLPASQHSRLIELRAQLAEPEGRIEALSDKAASLALVVEWGQEWLRDKAEREGAVKAFESPMLARWFTAFESFRRAVESLHRMAGKSGDGGALDYEALLEQERKRHAEDTTAD